MARLPSWMRPITKAREVVGDRHYYPVGDVLTTRKDGHRYRLIMWRDTSAWASRIGYDTKQAVPGLRYLTKEIKFYLNPSDPRSSQMVTRYGLYVRME